MKILFMIDQIKFKNKFTDPMMSYNHINMLRSFGRGKGHGIQGIQRVLITCKLGCQCNENHEGWTGTLQQTFIFEDEVHLMYFNNVCLGSALIFGRLQAIRIILYIRATGEVPRCPDGNRCRLIVKSNIYHSHHLNYPYGNAHSFILVQQHPEVEDALDELEETFEEHDGMIRATDQWEAFDIDTTQWWVLEM